MKWELRIQKDRSEFGRCRIWNNLTSLGLGPRNSRECHLLALSHAFEKLSLRAIYFETDEPNVRMRRFFEKYAIPFQLVTEEKYHRYELSIKDWSRVWVLFEKDK